MQAVDAEYTANSIKEGERVKAQLQRGLTAAGIGHEFEYQGSVPLDIHLKKHSDIDLLVLHGDVLTYDRTGPAATSTGYTPVQKTALQYVLEMRGACERILVNAYPEADVDTSGSKSITLSGGSLRRKVDVVPSHWHDTADYQRTKQKHDREVNILDKSVPMTLSNAPFLHMKKIEEKEQGTFGGAKKVIRFLKTLKADSDQKIGLSSYDISSLVWHFDTVALIKPSYSELALVAVAQAELDGMCRNYDRTSRLWTPDGSRLIIDQADKFTALQKLSAEVTAVASDIASELDPLAPYYPDRVRPALEKAFM
jgi:hypothetical protein